MLQVYVMHCNSLLEISWIPSQLFDSIESLSKLTVVTDTELIYMAL